LQSAISFIAKKNFRGSKCLECHGVDENSVLGSVSIIADIKPDQDELQSINRWLWLGQIVLQIALFLVIGAIVRRQPLSLGAEPAQATQLTQSVASGDLCTPIDVRDGDKESMMAQLRLMQSSLSSIVARVSSGSEGVAIASQEISEGNDNLSAHTEQQAAALEETASSMDQLGATVRQNADSARESNQLTLNVRDTVPRTPYLYVRLPPRFFF
jgi:methyl-accepting chemotaxis protein